MNGKKAYSLLKKLEFVRTGGSKEELEAANILLNEIKSIKGEARIEPFEVQDSVIKEARLEVISPKLKQYPVTGYSCSGSTSKEGLEAPFYYLQAAQEIDFLKAKDKVVLVNGYMNYDLYEKLAKSNVKGFITYSGDIMRDSQSTYIDERELRAQLHQQFGKIFGLHMKTKDAMSLIQGNPDKVRIKLTQDETIGESRNVVAEILGNTNKDEVIVFTAHYDSVPFSKGVYDNGAGSVILMELYRYFSHNAPKRTLRFIWCGSEERGLLGSKAYVKQHQDELEKIVLCINVDVGGVVLGKDIAMVTADNSLLNYVDYMAKEKGFSLEAKQDIYSSDCMPFVDAGIPAINFARFGSDGAAHIHDSYDKMGFISASSLETTGNIVEEFASRMANSCMMPVPKKIPENIVDKVNKYLKKNIKKD